jgi:hypothetical protein
MPILFPLTPFRFLSLFHSVWSIGIDLKVCYSDYVHHQIHIVHCYTWIILYYLYIVQYTYVPDLLCHFLAYSCRVSAPLLPLFTH